MKDLFILLFLILFARVAPAQTESAPNEEISRDTVANMVIVQSCHEDSHIKCWDVFFDNFSHEYAAETERRSFRDSIRRPRVDADVFITYKDEYTLSVAGDYAIRHAAGDDITQILNDSTVIDLRKWRNIGAVIRPHYTLDRHSHLRQLKLIYHCMPDKEDAITAADISRIAYAIDTRIVFGDWAAFTSDRKFFDFLPYITTSSPLLNRYPLCENGVIEHPRPEQRFGSAIKRDSIR